MTDEPREEGPAASFDVTAPPAPGVVRCEFCRYWWAEAETHLTLHGKRMCLDGDRCLFWCRMRWKVEDAREREHKQNAADLGCDEEGK